MGESEPICREFEALSPRNIDSTSIFAVFSGESEPNFHESAALSRAAFQYNGHTCHPPGILFLSLFLIRAFGESFPCNFGTVGAWQFSNILIVN